MKEKMSIMDKVMSAAVKLIEGGIIQEIRIYNTPDHEKIQIELFKNSMSLTINREAL